MRQSGDLSFEATEWLILADIMVNYEHYQELSKKLDWIELFVCYMAERMMWIAVEKRSCEC